MNITNLQNLVTLARRGLASSVATMPIEEAQAAVESIKAGEEFVRGLVAQQQQAQKQPLVEGPVQVVNIPQEQTEQPTQN
jgi:hypothetical protein